MTAAGGAALGLALGLYLAAAALSHGGALLGCASEAGARWARSLLLAGWTAHAAGLALRLAFSPGPPAAASVPNARQPRSRSRAARPRG